MNAERQVTHGCFDITAARIKHALLSENQNVESVLLAIGVVAEVECEMPGVSGLSFDGGNFVAQQVSERTGDILSCCLVDLIGKRLLLLIDGG